MTAPHIISRVKESTDLMALVAEHQEMRKSGAQHLIVCPWHADHQPSCRVYPDHLHCFSCQANGDCFTYLQAIEGISFAEALKRLAARAGISLDQRPISRQAQRWAREEAACCRWWWDRKRERITAQALADADSYGEDLDPGLCEIIGMPLARVLALSVAERFADFRARCTERERAEWRASVAEAREFADAWMRSAA